MVATLQSRKEALEAKILEKNEELKRLCLQEADLTGVMPPEIPLEPGEPPPPIRRRVGTSFSFPQNLLHSAKDADDESLTALELECRVQINIAEAALALANDSSANKAARRKHRLMYRQSQRRLMELETKLNLLKQGKSQQVKSQQQIKKKPRPNTTAVENLGFLWKKSNEQGPNFHSTEYLGSWPGKMKPSYSLEDTGKSSKDFQLQNDALGSLQRSFKCSGTSQSSSSPRTDISSEEAKLSTYPLHTSNSFPNHFIPNLLPHQSMPGTESSNVNLSSNAQHHKKNGKKPVVKRQWDTQSAGGTLLPSQTYPDHSHQPNLSRTQSLGSVESNTQKNKDSWSVQDFAYEGNPVKQKEWYETSLDSAPSPPLRTTSRLPSTARMLYQMQEMQMADPSMWVNPNIGNLQVSVSHPALPVTPNNQPPSIPKHQNFVKPPFPYPQGENRNSDVESISNSVQHMHLSSNNRKGPGNFGDDFGVPNLKELFYPSAFNDKLDSVDYPGGVAKPVKESVQPERNSRIDLSYPSTSNDPRFFQSSDGSNFTSPLTRQNSLGHAKLKPNIEPEVPGKGQDSISQAISHNNNNNNSNNIYANIVEDNPDGPLRTSMNNEQFNNQIKVGQIAVPQEYVPKPQTPTQPYYHMTRNATGEKIKNLQYQAAKNHQGPILEEPKPPSPLLGAIHHPPHAITQNEISFDTVVPFESPQNHTVVQAGKWQPYREVTKPFEMSDFYKYSTKFRQNQAQANRAVTPEVSGNSSSVAHQKGVYTPLKPMTCRPVESKCNQMVVPSTVTVQCEDKEKTLVEVSPPEIV